jgi:NADPH-dependent F420 reductase
MDDHTYGIIGGTGPEGKGIALRLSKVGLKVAIGSRDLSKAKNVACELSKLISPLQVGYGTNSSISEISDILFLTIPYTAQKSVLENLAPLLTNKIIINTGAPIQFKEGKFSSIHVSEGSAAKQTQILLPKSKVVSAFQTISAKHLLDINSEIKSDVIVCSNFEDSKTFVMSLISKIPVLKPIDGGSIDNSVYVENFTALLLNINKKYKVLSSVKILGL